VCSPEELLRIVDSRTTAASRFKRRRKAGFSDRDRQGTTSTAAHRPLFADGRGLYRSLASFKETVVSKSKKTSTEHGAETVALLDCGQASKVTQGFPFFLFFEGGWPPLDRLLV
jgi:hypothetical protein